MIVALGVVVLVALAVLLLVVRPRSPSIALGRRAIERDVGRWTPSPTREPAPPEAAVTLTAPTPWTPPTEETIGVTRRRFLNRGLMSLLGVSAGAMSGSFLAMLWPQSSGGFGSKVHVARADIDTGLARGHGFFYVPEGRLWVTAYPSTALTKAKKVYSSTELTMMEAGYVFLYQKCPHLGCRVPSCTTSQWFECPCHGSKYNRVGEKKAGPAPRGMDRFPTDVQGEAFVVDTGRVILGPAIGTNTTGQEAEGPHCIGATTSH
jgi:cytochrome b6-f complex iron-sulfur subunit